MEKIDYEWIEEEKREAYTMLSDSEKREFDLRKKSLLHKVKAAEEALYQDPPIDESNNLKELAFAWIELVPYSLGDNKRAYDKYRLAADYLEALLKINKHDFDAWWKLGELYTYLSSQDDLITDRLSSEEYKENCCKAVDAFKKAMTGDPQLYKETAMVKRAKKNKRWCFPSPDRETRSPAPEYFYSKTDEMEGELMCIRDYESDCRHAKREYDRNPRNAKNLMSWGIALEGLSWFYEGEVSRKLKLLKDAKKRFEMVLNLRPHDKEAKCYLAEVNMDIGMMSKVDKRKYKELKEKYIRARRAYCPENESSADENKARKKRKSRYEEGGSSGQKEKKLRKF